MLFTNYNYKKKYIADYLGTIAIIYSQTCKLSYVP